MNRYGKRLAAGLIVTTVLASWVLTGCTWKSPADGTSGESGTGNTSDRNTTADSGSTPVPDGDLLTYYESRISEMKETLLKERQERYISEYEYRERLEKLERELELLAAGAELDTAKQVSGKPDKEPTDTEEQTHRPEPDPILHPTPLPSSCFRYTVRDGEVTVTGYLGNAGTVTIPAEINGCPVVAIGDGAFRNAALTSVVLPESVKTIGWFSFADCTDLESITLPSSLRSISYAAFDNCPNLTALCIRDSYAARWAASYGLPVQYI